MGKIYKLFLPFFFFLFITGSFSQTTLVGVVTDSLTQEPLVGTNVYLVGTAFGSSTDFDGAYRIEGIPEGSYTLRVSYLGYRSKDLPLQIGKEKRKVIHVQLVYDVIEGEAVYITAQAEGQVAAINQQIRSNTIINVVSEEKIQELPDANAAEAVGRLPGVALQRSGGEANKVVLRGLSPRFSSVSIDGVRIPITGADIREVDLSTLSQRSLAGIELYKSLTADQDADAIAGGLNFVTKKAPSIRSLRVDARGSYNDIERSYNQYDLSVKFGERYFNERLGLQFTGNLEQRIRSEEDIDLDYDLEAEGGRTWYFKDLKLNYIDELRKRNGASVILDLNTPDGGSVKFSNIYSKTNRDFTEYYRNYPVSIVETPEVYYSARKREENISTFNSFLKGENYLYGFTLEWNLSYARSKSDFPFDFELNFREPSTTDAQGNVTSGMRNPPTDLLHGPPEAIIPYAVNAFDKAFLYSAFYRGQDSKEEEKSAYLNISRNYTLGKLYSGTLKMGGKYRNKSRSRSKSELFGPYYNFDFRKFVRLPDGSIVPKENIFAGTRFEDLKRVGENGIQGSGNILFTNFLPTDPEAWQIFDKYELYPLVDKDALTEWWELSKDGTNEIGSTSEYFRYLEPDAEYYDIDERVYAGYMMNTFNRGQNISLITGLRVESEDNDYHSKYSPVDLNGYPVPVGVIRDTFAVHQETVWLPNFHLTVRPTHFMSVRLAAYKALARPDFNHRLENFIAKKTSTFYSGNTLIIGNPELKAAKAWNFELNNSFYESQWGLFSVSAFYKDIKDMFHLIDGLLFKGESNQLDSLGINYRNPFPADYELTYPINSTKPTRVWGFECELQSNLRFLPGLLKNIVINGNLSIVRSETYIPRNEYITYLDTIPNPPFPPYIYEKTRTNLVERKQKLEGQPDFFGNFTIGYDIKGFSARLSVFHQGEYNKTFSPNSKQDDIVNSFTRWDLSFRQRINRFLLIYLNINNLTNTKEGTSIINRVDNWTLLNKEQTYGISGDLGLRVEM